MDVVELIKKKIWKDETTNDEWKIENIKTLKKD